MVINPSLKHWLKVIGIPSGRKLIALRRVLKLALARGLTDFAATVQAAIEIEEENRRKRKKAGKIVPRAQLKTTGMELTEVLSGIQEICFYYRKIFRDKPKGKMAAEILNDVFQGGVIGITRQSYEEKSEDIRAAIKLFDNEYLEHVQTIPLYDLVEELKTYYSSFVEQLDKTGQNKITGDELRKAKLESENAYLGVIARILGLFPYNTPEDIKTRIELLNPIHEQIQAVKAYRKQRRKVRDLDPQTGEVVFEDKVVSKPEDKTDVKEEPKNKSES